MVVQNICCTGPLLRLVNSGLVRLILASFFTAESASVQECGGMELTVLSDTPLTSLFKDKSGTNGSVLFI